MDPAGGIIYCKLYLQHDGPLHWDLCSELISERGTSWCGLDTFFEAMNVP